MSNFIKKTRNPFTGKMEDALWADDYFGKHKYGVAFPSNPDAFYNPEAMPGGLKLETEDEPKKEEWEERWDELGKFLTMKYGTHIHPNHIKSFIKSLLQDQEARVKRKTVKEILMLEDHHTGYIRGRDVEDYLSTNPE